MASGQQVAKIHKLCHIIQCVGSQCDSYLLSEDFLSQTTTFVIDVFHNSLHLTLA